MHCRACDKGGAGAKLCHRHFHHRAVDEAGVLRALQHGPQVGPF